MQEDPIEVEIKQARPRSWKRTTITVKTLGGYLRTSSWRPGIFVQVKQKIMNFSWRTKKTTGCYHKTRPNTAIGKHRYGQSR